MGPFDIRGTYVFPEEGEEVNGEVCVEEAILVLLRGLVSVPVLE